MFIGCGWAHSFAGIISKLVCNQHVWNCVVYIWSWHRCHYTLSDKEYQYWVSRVNF